MHIDELTAELKQLKDEKYHLLKLVNHDIRSPFNRIFALLQLFEMESGEFSDQQKEYLDSMYLSILSGLEMIQNLRDMREIDAGNIELDNTAYDLVPIIHKSIRTFSKQIELKNLKIETEIEDEPMPIFNDEYYTQRVIENVFSNAVKFSKQGKEISVKIRKTDKVIEILIQDSGKGVAQEEESLLYKKFTKLSAIATGGEGSIGLGLYNTLYFLNKLNGKIILQRNEQRGSLFIIQLPIP